MLIIIGLVVLVIILVILGILQGKVSYSFNTTKKSRSELDENERSFAEIIEEEIEYNPEYAIKLLKKHLRSNPQDDNMRFTLAKVLYEQQRFAEAIRHLEHLMKYLSTRIDLSNFLGKAYAGYGIEHKAIECYKKTLNIDEHNVEATKELAELYAKTNQRRNAIKTYRQLLKLINTKESVVATLCGMAKVYESEEDIDEAINCYQKALSIEPNLEILMTTKELFKKSGNHDEVINILKKLFAVNEYDYDIYEELMISLYKADKYDEVIELSKRITVYPDADICNVQNIIAKAYIKTEKIQESITLLNAIQQQFPENAYLYQTLAQAYMAANNYEKAIKIYEELIDKSDVSKIKMWKSNLSSTYCNYGSHLYKEGRYNQAFEKFEIAMQYDNSNPEIYYQIGYCNYLIKNYSDAIFNIKKAINLDPTKVLYKLTLAAIYYEIDNVNDALRLYETVLSIDSDNISALSVAGIIYAKQLHPERAIENFKTVLMLEPENINIRYNLALAYEYVSKKEDAIKEYYRILEIDPEHEATLNNLAIIKPTT